MRERGDILMTLAAAFVLLFPLGFVVHASPRFPGSLAGSLTGIAAAVLMLLPLVHVAARRIGRFGRWLDHRIEKRTLLAIHIYAGVAGPILALVHAAHKFESPLGIALTGTVILVVWSGFVGRYFLVQITRAVRARTSELAVLRLGLEADLARAVPIAGGGRPKSKGWRFLFAPADEFELADIADARRRAEALADAEYAVRAERAAAGLFGGWRAIHVVTSTLLYALLLLHIWAGYYFGFRWL
ncbi:hypothetical protein OVY29_24030 [Sphingopyxis sp. SE2]|jgi:hypothetical protein|uniref:Ferric reductase like protein n=1 Tax=Blastomonas natatoria TaxID=34015 RepID=A0A2V3UP80_9SPHN|nr:MULTISPECIES: hypothetical protein [Sphingomonadaceae]MDT7531725.1 hypothetical protein [Sphingopyxis sp. SE2]PXW68298.1 hypothetical protein C7451_11821 [Blastomonas natatoria]